MKKMNTFKKCACILTLLCMLGNISYGTISTITISASEVQPLSDDIRWRYKIVDGKYYKRLYNYTKLVWIGDWILVNSGN